MTEAEWLACEDPARFWAFFQQTTSSPRKNRLHACACMRLVWGRLSDVRQRQAVEVAERFADGQCKRKELHRAQLNASAVARQVLSAFGYQSPEYELASAVESVARKDVDQPWHLLRFRTGRAGPAPAEEGDHATLVRRESALLRDIFGNPFRPVTLPPSWRTDTATALARQMYDSRDFGAMPILADALQDAGCDGEGILSHCRDARAAHVRGCWVVDLVLGKS